MIPNQYFIDKLSMHVCSLLDFCGMVNICRMERECEAHPRAWIYSISARASKVQNEDIDFCNSAISYNSAVGEMAQSLLCLHLQSSDFFWLND